MTLAVLCASIAAAAQQPPPPPQTPAPAQGAAAPSPAPAAAAASAAGIVRSAGGQIIPGAPVRFTNADTDKIWVSWTDETGKFVFPALPPGDYHVEASQVGFVPAPAEVHLPGPSDHKIELVLRIATVQELAAAAAQAAAPAPAPPAGRRRGTSRHRAQHHRPPPPRLPGMEIQARRAVRAQPMVPRRMERPRMATDRGVGAERVKPCQPET